jgi:two-component system CitB family sensor kinase
MSSRWRRRGPLTWRTQLSLAVLLLVAAVIVASLTGSLIAARYSIEWQSEQRALAIARTVASDPRYAAWVLDGQPEPNGPTQSAAEQLRVRTDALYVVVTDRRGVRYSHPHAALIGQVVSTDPSVPLAGGEVVAIEQGTLGWSARGKVPLRDVGGQIVGSVSVGIAISAVDALQRQLLLVMLGVGGLALAASLLALTGLSRRLRRVTHGLELEEMADLLREHAAVLGGALEGVVAVDPAGRVRLANDAARRYLGTDVAVGDPAAAGLPDVAELIGPAAGDFPEAGRLVVLGGRILLVRRVSVERHGRDLGTVLVLADRTDLDDLGRELEATRALTDALRAQSHEYANRLHALAGLLHLGHVEEAEEYLAQLTGAEAWTRGVEDPYLSGILAAKGAVASEQGVDLRIADATWVDGRLTRPLDAVTVIGNLLDNAVRAAANGSQRPAWVEVSLLSDGADLVVQVVDSGDGVPPGKEEAVFADGWTTKESDRDARGIGLALARATARHHGGDVELQRARGVGHGAMFGARLRGALLRPRVPRDLLPQSPKELSTSPKEGE